MSKARINELARHRPVRHAITGCIMGTCMTNRADKGAVNRRGDHRSDIKLAVDLKICEILQAFKPVLGRNSSENS